MITWRDIQTSLHNVDDNRLDDPAVFYDANGETIAIDMLEIEVPEINDSRLVSIPLP